LREGVFRRGDAETRSKTKDKKEEAEKMRTRGVGVGSRELGGEERLWLTNF